MPKPQPSAVPGLSAESLYSVVLLAAYSLALSLILAATSPTTPAAPASKPAAAPVGVAPAPAAPAAPSLPATQPGISHDEGWFLLTAADDGSRAIYFIAGNTRHSIQANDLQLELQNNPLWPTRQASQDEVLAFAEGAPIGAGKAGLLGAAAPDEAAAPTEVAAVEPAAAPQQAPAPDASLAAPAPADAAPAAPSQPAAPAAPTAPQPAQALAPAPAQPAAAATNAAPATNPPPAAPQPAPAAPTPAPAPATPQPAQAPAPAQPAPVATNTAAAAPSQPGAAPANAAPAAPNQGAAAPAVAQAPAAADDNTPLEPTVIVLRPGDNLTHIARDYGTSVQAILDANGVANPNRIYVGQSLVIPNAGADTDSASGEAPAAPAAVTPEQTADTITASEATGDAAASEPAGGDTAGADNADNAAAAATYTVKPGDSAFKIALRFGIDQAALLDANGITNPNRVYAGQVLTIPS